MSAAGLYEVLLPRAVTNRLNADCFAEVVRRNARRPQLCLKAFSGDQIAKNIPEFREKKGRISLEIAPKSRQENSTGGTRQYVASKVLLERCVS